MPEQPTGTVTFLFTEVEGSAQLWEQQPAATQAALDRHHLILRTAIAQQAGSIFKTLNEGVCAAFPTAPDALAAALAAQRELAAESWALAAPLQVRMALHTGTVEERAGDYLGPPLNRTARLLAAGHGGQILLSLATQELVRDQLPGGTYLQDLGEHRLRDLTRPEHLFQLVAADRPAQFPALQTLDARPNNLPAQSTDLIGREPEVAAVAALLRRKEIRLVTLTGPGGTGKTRLGLQVAAELLDAFPAGCWFVPLAAVADPALVAPTVAATLGIRETAGQALTARLKDYLGAGPVLLILDNFEQILPAAALVADLLAGAPHLKILVTSRTVLRCYGEQEFSVPPLALPDPRHLPALDRLAQYEAVRLFSARAQAVKPEFVITQENAPAVAAICARLDGLPLAIELAAARIKILPAQALLARLGSRMTLLTGGARDVPARHQTLRGAIAWSHDLLDPAERILFRRLAVFAGGWTLEAAEHVGGDEGSELSTQDFQLSTLDGIASLMDKSLVRPEELEDGEPRFGMLETIREYALAALAASGEAEAVRRAHGAYYLALAEQAEAALRGPQQSLWLARLEREHDNLRASLQGALERGEPEFAVRLAGALWAFWNTHGHLSEGRRWLETALTSAECGVRTAEENESPGTIPQSALRTPHWAKALFGGGVLAYTQGDYGRAQALLEESLRLRRARADAPGIAQTLNALGAVADGQGQPGAAQALFEESLARQRELGDKRGIAQALNNLGAIALKAGDTARAIALLEESPPLFRALGDKRALALTLNNLAELLRAQGLLPRAQARLEESLALFREIGDRRGIAIALTSLGDVAGEQHDYGSAAARYREGLVLYQVVGDRESSAVCLEGLAGVLSALGEQTRAVRLFAAAAAVRQAIGAPHPPSGRSVMDRQLAGARRSLGDAAFTAAWAAGQAIALDAAIADALADTSGGPDAAVAPPAGHAGVPPAEPGPPYPDDLTRREVEVLRLIAAGLTDAQVADRLVLSTRTVQGHVRSIYSKLDITTRSAATRYAMEHRLV
ncbi:MAG TPA: tetratricopeptide repeat protein [Chloroflexia bacterium]|nr:tetratricopeptide repeat protein [Chloroflexia bacterium]